MPRANTSLGGFDASVCSEEEEAVERDLLAFFFVICVPPLFFVTLGHFNFYDKVVWLG